MLAEALGCSNDNRQRRTGASMIPRILTRWLRLRRAKRLAKWYYQHPCAYSWQEPWLSASERKHSKGGL